MAKEKRAGVHNCHYDLRAKALTDKEAAEGMQQTLRVGAQSTESQTADLRAAPKGAEDGGDAMITEPDGPNDRLRARRSLRGAKAVLAPK